MPIVSSDESTVEGVKLSLSYTPPDIAELRAKPAGDLTPTEVEVIAAFDRLGV